MSASPLPEIDSILLPIFPLNTVLFPGGCLPLRVFEARYMEMVSDCLREGLEFGVCLIRKGREVGGGAQPEAIGCRATITDWNMEQLGVLQIEALGTQRFRIESLRPESNGLLRASAADLEDEATVPVPAQFQSCKQLLARIIAQQRDRNEGADTPGKRPIASPYRLDDASWVGNRLCEVLPISLVAKQKLMELTDAQTRLSIVHQYLQQQKII